MKKYLAITLLAFSIFANGCKKTEYKVPETPNPAAGLTITDFNPKSAKPFTNITITGTGFGNDPQAVKVFVGNTSYVFPTSITPTSLTVPTNLANQSGKIKVIVNGIEVVSTADFTALPPDLKVDGYDSDKGVIGKDFYIKGNGFGTDTSKVLISFGGSKPVHSTYISLTGFTIGAPMPADAQPGKVTVTANGQTVTCQQLYDLNLSIRDFTPKIVGKGDTIKITGVKFTTPSDMSVTFNAPTEVWARPFKVTPTELWVIVPNAKINSNRSIEIRSSFGQYSALSIDNLIIKP